MPVTTRTTSLTPGNSAAEIATAHGYFTTGNIITSQNILYLSQLIRNISAHTHGIIDFSTVHTFGNVGSTAFVNETTGGNTLTTLVSAPVGSVITATDFNKIRTDISTMRSHNHSWTDN